MDTGEFSGHRFHTELSELGFDYRLRLWAPTSALRIISVVAELFGFLVCNQSSLVGLCIQDYESVCSSFNLCHRG